MPSAEALNIGFRGLNRILAPALISPGESPDTTDADFYTNLIGTLGARPGRSRVTSYTTYSYLGVGMLAVPTGRFRVSATADGKWHAQGIAWPGLSTPADLADVTGKDATETVRFLQYKERVMGVNGKNRPIECDGAGWTFVGITRPVFTPTVASGGAGTFLHQGGALLPSFSIFTPAQFGTGKAKTGPTRPQAGSGAGPYTYYVTACNSKKLNINGRAIESNPCDPSNEITPSAGLSITVGGIPATHEDPQVDSWNIYRNKSGIYDTDLSDNDQDFFYVGSVTIGTTTFTDNVPDYQLTGADRLSFERNIPPSCEMIALFGDRVFLTGFKPINTGTATKTGAVVDFSGVTLPDGVLGAWFKKDGEATLYRIISVGSATQVTLDRSFSGTLSASGYTIFRRPWEIYISQMEDQEAWGLGDEGERWKIEIPGRHPITAMMPFMGSLLVFTHHNIYQISGMGPNREDIRIMPNPLYRGIGCCGPDALCLAGDTLFFMDPTNGPMMLNGGSPQPVGALLNQDWYENLTSAELAIACMGTDDQYVYVSVPVSGQVMNSKTYRYHIVTQTWWEEKGLLPRQFIREDGASGALNTLYYIQGRWLLNPRSGTLDLVSAALAGTTTGSASAQSVTDSGAAFPTSNGGLEECWLRLYSLTTNLLLWERRIISNTATVLTWSADTTLPGSTENGQGSEIIGARYEIGNVPWRWMTKAFDGKEPFNRKQSQDFLALFHSKSDTAHIWKDDIIDGIVQNKLAFFEAKELCVQMPAGGLGGESNFTLAAIIGSRDSAILRALDVRAQVQEGIVL